MKNVELVFRTVGERTSNFALEFALRNIRPNKYHIIENVKPFSKALERNLNIVFDPETEFVIFLDADCLILEDMRPFINSNNRPYVDCYVLDKFRGRIHLGVHITRIDVVKEMQRIEIPSNDFKYILRPESRLRNIALNNLNKDKFFKRFKILHDFCQYYPDIFVKYAIRELRSRTHLEGTKLESAMAKWYYDDKDFIVARKAIEFTREYVSGESSPEEVQEFIVSLPQIADLEIKNLNIKEKKPLEIQEILDLKAALNFIGEFDSKKEKIFCIGLSRTSTKSLTYAINNLGYNVIHYPVDEQTFLELINGNYRFSLLDDYDGIADITVAPFYRELDKIYPNSKFILTVRDKASWLESVKLHWDERPPFNDPKEEEIHLKIRRFLRASAYGVYKFARERLSNVYDTHLSDVLEYFKDKSDSLLVIDICSGEGYEKLCPFLGIPMLDQEFPNIKDKNEMIELV
jgi:hypothetical protein